MTGGSATYYWTDTIQTTRDYDIICSGDYSCADTVIKNANNLYCHGYESCFGTNLIENITNVYGYGDESLVSSRINNVENIYCGTYYGCDDAIFSNVTSVYCIGGWSACENTVITGVANIYAFGETALYSATIISNLSLRDDQDTLTVKICGTHDERFDIYCSEGDICKIDCDSEQACTGLYLTCHGTCYVRCDEDNGIDCPIHWGGVVWETTGEPSTIPSNNPTQIPSAIPTNLPTVPTSMPTTVPTIIPSVMPSISSTASPTSQEFSSSIATTTIEPSITEDVSSDETASDNSNGWDGLNDTIVIVLMVCITQLIVLGMVAIVVVYWKKETKELELAKLQLESAVTANNNDSYA